VAEFGNGEDALILYCCECGAAHRFAFEGTRGKMARIRVHVRPRLTAAYRKRARGLPMVPREDKP
jgi:hypothetical protein